MVKEVPLSQGLVALVDDEDYEAVMQYKWYAHKGKHGTTHYAIRNRRKSENETRAQEKMHRFIAGAEEGMDVDHINGNGLKNTRDNLRVCTHRQNMFNRGGNVVSASPYRGVVWNKQSSKWKAQLKFQGRNFYLGEYDDPKDAALAYDAKAKELFGEFARLNLAA